MLYIDAKDLQFTDEPEGWHKAVFDLVAMTFGDNGQPIDNTNRTYTIRIKGQTYENAMRAGIIYNVAHPVKKPGAYQMRAVVRDAGTGQVGSASQFIEIPDVAKGRLTLSSVVLKEMAPEGQPAATTDHPEGQVTEANPQGSAAVRIFHPGASLLYGYLVLNAQAESAQKSQLEVQTRLFRDGHQIYAGKVNPMDVTGQPDPKRLVAGGTMKLGQIAPGDYVLQVIVTDKLAKERYRTASAWMDFEVK